MHLNEIARELKIPVQNLRRELEKTNFGINPNAHEIDDALAAGVIRFLKGKIKPVLKERRVAVILKSGEVMKEEALTQKEEGEEKKEKEDGEVKPKPKRAMTKREKEELERKEQEAQAPALAPSTHEAYNEPKDDRKHVPRHAPKPKPQDDFSVKVSRRIEVEPAAKTPAADESLPHHYYKKKKRRKGGRQEPVEMESMQRHPGRKIKIAKVHYNDGEFDDEMSAEELAIEREIDRERFKEQKRHRAASQAAGPKAQPQIKAKTGAVPIPSILSLKEFSEKCGLPVTQVIATLFKNGIMATINQKLDFDTAALVAAELGVEVVRQEEEASTEDLFSGDIKKLLEEEDKGKLIKRPPVISIMGHVDHGKTKLLDTIRSANVVDTEAGGITQHIGAYQVEKSGELITFLDTPGHEAFTSMRARGAKATDIAILVVAADEGVKPQTIEAIHHAQEAGIPIIVAINKIDKPAANPEKVKGELVEYGLQSEDWGGKTIMVPVSAITGEGIDKLLEMILLVAELEEFKANPNRLAVGTVVEAHLDKALGPVATILVNTGTLNVGDSVVVGTSVGKIKVMHNHLGQIVPKASPSAAVRISGLQSLPHAGDLLQAFSSEKLAKATAEGLKSLRREQEERLSGSMVERIVSQISSGQVSFLKLVLKADTKGSLEAIMQALKKIKSTDVAVKVIHFGVGNISDTDVVMAAASQALLVGFHVEAGAHVQKLAEREHVDIKHYTIIYKLIEDVKAILSGMLEPEINIVELGKIELKEIFLNKKKWVIAGGTVVSGKVESGSMVRVTRGGETLFETKLESLKHVKEDMTELEKGADCGLRISTPKPVEPGDILEVFKIQKIERKLEE